MRLIRDGEKGEKGVWRLGKREIIYLSLHCHHQKDSCIKMGIDESHLNVSVVTRQCPQTTTFLKRNDSRSGIEPTSFRLPAQSPFLTGRMFVRPNILRTLRRTMIRFLIELLVRRTWFGQSKLYFVLNWFVMRCKLRPELAADAQQTA